MIRIALLGGPGVGKTSQAAHFFATLKSKNIKAEYVQEYAREAINKGIVKLNAWVQFLIYEEQKAKEDCIPQEIDYMITDSPILLSYIYALREAGPEDQELLIRMYRNFVYDIARYDYIFCLEREKPYILDGTRKQNKEEAEDTDRQIRFLLDMHKVNYYVLKGFMDERTNTMMDTIQICTY